MDRYPLRKRVNDYLLIPRVFYLSGTDYLYRGGHACAWRCNKQWENDSVLYALDDNEAGPDASNLFLLVLSGLGNSRAICKSFQS